MAMMRQAEFFSDCSPKPEFSLAFENFWVYSNVEWVFSFSKFLSLLPDAVKRAASK